MHDGALGQLNIDFRGSDYDPARDLDRLTAQQARIYEVMIDGAWRSVEEIQHAVYARFSVHDPAQSIARQVRYLRAMPGIEVRKRFEGNGCYRWRLTT